MTLRYAALVKCNDLMTLDIIRASSFDPSRDNSSVGKIRLVQRRVFEA